MQRPAKDDDGVREIEWDYIIWSAEKREEKTKGIGTFFFLVVGCCFFFFTMLGLFSFFYSFFFNPFPPPLLFNPATFRIEQDQYAPSPPALQLINALSPLSISSVSVGVSRSSSSSISCPSQASKQTTTSLLSGMPASATKSTWKVLARTS